MNKKQFCAWKTRLNVETDFRNKVRHVEVRNGTYC